MDDYPRSRSRSVEDHEGGWKERSTEPDTQQPILKDTKRRLELAGFHVRAPTMSTLQITAPSMPLGMTTPRHSNCRRSKPRSRTRSGDSMLSDSSVGSASTAPPLQRMPPIAGDVFAMHPHLFSSPKQRDAHTVEASTTTLSPLAFWTHKRSNAPPARSPMAPATPKAPPSPSIIFIDCPSHQW